MLQAGVMQVGLQARAEAHLTCSCVLLLSSSSSSSSSPPLSALAPFSWRTASIAWSSAWPEPELRCAKLIVRNPESGTPACQGMESSTSESVTPAC